MNVEIDQIVVNITNAKASCDITLSWPPALYFTRLIIQVCDILCDQRNLWEPV